MPSTTTSLPSCRLDCVQRGRLMRSTRKLGEVLGTTPQLVEIRPELPITLLPIGNRSSSCSRSPLPLSPASVKVTKLARRYGSIFTHSEASSTSTSLSSAGSSVTSLGLSSSASSSSVDFYSVPKTSIPHRSADSRRPPPLVLHLNPVPLSPTDPRIEIFPPTPPSNSAVTSSATSPVDSSLMKKQMAEAKRRKMTKVIRTLGENVPQELVFPAPKTSSRSRFPSSRKNDPQIRHSRSFSTSAAYKPETWTAGASVCPQDKPGSWVGEWNRSDIREVQQHLRVLRFR